MCLSHSRAFEDRESPCSIVALRLTRKPINPPRAPSQPHHERCNGIWKQRVGRGKKAVQYQKNKKNKHKNPIAACHPRASETPSSLRMHRTARTIPSFLKTGTGNCKNRLVFKERTRFIPFSSPICKRATHSVRLWLRGGQPRLQPRRAARVWRFTACFYLLELSSFLPGSYPFFLFSFLETSEKKGTKRDYIRKGHYPVQDNPDATSAVSDMSTYPEASKYCVNDHASPLLRLDLTCSSLVPSLRTHQSQPNAMK